MTLTDKAVDSLKVDAIVVGVGKGPAGPVLPAGTGAVDAALGGRLGDALAALGATGAQGEVTTLASLGALTAPVVAASGLGPVPEEGGTYTAEAIRRAAGAASRALAGQTRVASTLALIGGAPSTDLVRAAAEGTLLGAYDFTGYRTADGHRALPSTFTLVVSNAKDHDAQQAMREVTAITDAVGFCRDLVNTPPNDLPPATFVARAQTAARKAGLEVEVLDEKALAKAGFGGLVGVGGGSTRPPRLLRLRYKGQKAQTKVALVGKGITFDSGGISLKPAEAMHVMKSDMGGAAAVVAAICAAAELKLPIEVIATVPVAENLPGSGSYRPGDVLTLYGGTTVEVLNTDAEGRLVLADAIVRAAEDEPAYLIETSTLTGAQLVALGKRTAGVMGSDALRDRVVGAGGLTGEGMWAMPLPEELRPALDSTVADIANVAGDKHGGMLVAGAFLAEFVPADMQWAHIDVAGPAFNTVDAWGYTPGGGTGVPVRTILSVLQDIAEHG